MIFPQRISLIFPGGGALSAWDGWILILTQPYHTNDNHYYASRPEEQKTLMINDIKMFHVWVAYFSSEQIQY